MNRRLLAAVAGSAMLIATIAPTAALAAGPSRPQVDRGTLGKIDPSFRPLLADANRRVTVVLQLKAAPAYAGAGLTKAQQRSRAATLRTAQGKLDGRIRTAGARVLGRYQYAYNGIRVSATGRGLATLAAMPEVAAIRPVQTFERSNVTGVPYIGGPSAWQSTGATGAGVTIAVIDSGIDYTHANFGGPGTVAAYDANDPAVIEPGTFPTAKVVGGYDFVGNDYDADGDLGSPTPTPDPDPLDCGNHGSHVAGTAAGQGVKADHTPFTGPYNASTLANPANFVVGPGVAPKASLIALKVFGCEGTTGVLVDALEWVAAYNVSHADGIDVVNMSLGAPFGANDDPSAVATNNLVDQGVVVVASAGNEAAVPYITGSPAAATKAISVAALDAYPQIPMALVDLTTGADIPGNNQNAYPSLPVGGTLHVLPAVGGGVSLGCTAADYDAATAGRIVAVKRGVCAFVDKGAAAAAAGAIGIVMINRDDTPVGDLPTFIGYNPEFFAIPMIGVDKTAQAALIANEGKAVTLKANGTAPNPTYQEIADFSSSGPRWGDSWLKPDVAAPGVNILSSLNGSGWNGTTYSGTSMAAPATAGTAALVRQVHPGWSPLKVKAAIVNTADASDAKILDYDPLRAGSGVVQANRAVATTVLATTSDRTTSLNYGYEQADGKYSETKQLTLTNTGNRGAWFKLEASTDLVTVWPSKVYVQGRDSVTIKVTASLSKAEVATLPSADQFLTGAIGELSSLSGVVTATPQSSGSGLYTLRVPYLLVPRGLSDVKTTLNHGATALSFKNHGVHDGVADVYALGIKDPRGDGANGTDLRAVGVQTLPASVLGVDDPNDRAIQFAVNVWDRFSSASAHEIDIAVDTNGDGEPDRWVIGIDDGALFAGAFDGIFISAIFDADFNLIDVWLADAPLNGSTVILPVLASELGLEDGSGSFTYFLGAFDGFTGAGDFTDTSAPFDAFNPAQSTGDFVPLASKAKATVPAWATPNAGVKGWMVVSLDDRNGKSQADLVLLRKHKGH